jgi:signal transduction histidine kinase
MLTELGLSAALEEHAEQLGQRISLDVPGHRLPPTAEMTLYYALTEALTNAHKYANADAMSVIVRIGESDVVGEVVDNGIGGASVTLGGGLHGVEDRVRVARGQFEVESPPGNGTRVRVTLPIEMAKS